MLPRKDKYSYEDPDMKQRPTTPVYMDRINNIKIPSQMKVPSYFPELPSNFINLKDFQFQKRNHLIEDQL